MPPWMYVLIKRENILNTLRFKGSLDFLLHENKKENVEEQFIEPYEDCVAMEELSGVSGKGT